MASRNNEPRKYRIHPASNIPGDVEGYILDETVYNINDFVVQENILAPDEELVDYEYIDVEDLSTNEEIEDEEEFEYELGVPENIVLVSQTARTVGTQTVIDVVFEFDDVEGAVDYDYRVVAL